MRHHSKTRATRSSNDGHRLVDPGHHLTRVLLRSERLDVAFSVRLFSVGNHPHRIQQCGTTHLRLEGGPQVPSVRQVAAASKVRLGSRWQGRHMREGATRHELVDEISITRQEHWRRVDGRSRTFEQQQQRLQP